MRVDTSEVHYESLYTLTPGDTFIYEGKLYLVIEGSVYNCVTRNTHNIYEDNMKEVAVLDLVFNEIKIFDKYTRVYPRKYKVVGDMT